MEAKILHVPVVASHFGSVGEFLHDGVNALVAPIDRIGESVRSLIEDKALYRRLKKGCSEYVHDNRRGVDRIVALFEE